MEILLRALEVLSKHSFDIQGISFNLLSENVIDVCHNSISQEEHFCESLFLHRKGAMHLPAGCVGFIPGSMGTETFVVESRANGYAFNSCSHGAGRSMSRREAVRNINISDFKTHMNGIVYDESVSCVDEAPSAYKNIRHVMRSQKDLVKILHKLNPVLSMKG
jgi:tRNA-splicing ligase RtcB